MFNHSVRLVACFSRVFPSTNPRQTRQKLKSLKFLSVGINKMDSYFEIIASAGGFFFRYWQISLIVTLAIGIGAWIHSYKLSNLRLQRALRVSIVFLAFPIPILEPFTINQIWLFVFMYTFGFFLPGAIVLLSTWAFFVAISQADLPKKQNP